MKTKIIEKSLTILIAAIVTINVYAAINTWLLMNANAVLREKKAMYILPDGFTPEKEKITWDESLPSPSGWVVRYASKGCAYCAQDTEWDRLVPLLDRHNYRTLLFLPKESDQFDEDGMLSRDLRQMAFVKMDWIKQFRFTGTPTVVVFDKTGRVLWGRVGKLNEADYDSVERVIVRNAQSGKSGSGT